LIIWIVRRERFFLLVIALIVMAIGYGAISLVQGIGAGGAEVTRQLQIFG